MIGNIIIWTGQFRGKNQCNLALLWLLRLSSDFVPYLESGAGEIDFFAVVKYKGLFSLPNQVRIRIFSNLIMSGHNSQVPLVYNKQWQQLLDNQTMTIIIAQFLQ